MTASPGKILNYWFVDTPSTRWFGSDPAFDDAIRARFESTWREGRDGALDAWSETPDGALALVLLFDQFPRNMFRGQGQAFSTDAKARRVASLAVEKDYDKAAPAERRQFFYMPFMHSEVLADQERCVALIRENLGRRIIPTLSRSDIATSLPASADFRRATKRWARNDTGRG